MGMTEERAREILGENNAKVDRFKSFAKLEYNRVYEDRAYLDGCYTAEELEALAWFMRNKGK